MCAYPSLTANASLFAFKMESGKYADDAAFAVYAFSGREVVCKPFEFSIELISTSADVDSNELLGVMALLSIKDRSGEQRLVHGKVRAMEQLHTANQFTHYRCTLVPRPRGMHLEQYQFPHLYQMPNPGRRYVNILWLLPNQKTFSGIQSREFHAAGRNLLVMDDTQG